MSPTLSLLVAATLTAQVPAGPAKDYAELLAKHVKGGRVDYRAISGAELKKLDGYLAAVAAAPIPTDRLAAIAFYVDAYNALILRAVITHGRPRSVLDVKDFFDAKSWLVAGKTLSLNQLEKEVLGPLAQDPRTHMVLVCGAVGCPILEDRPYAGSDLEARLDAATRRYLAAPAGAVVERGALKLSKIFDWYDRDFGGPAGVVSFVLRHLDPGARAIAGDNPKVTFTDYNWTLNQQ